MLYVHLTRCPPHYKYHGTIIICTVLYIYSAASGLDGPQPARQPDEVCESQHSIICSVFMKVSDVMFIFHFAFSQTAGRKGKENGGKMLCTIVFIGFAPNPLYILKMVAIIPFEPLFLRNRNPIFWILSFLRIPYVLTMDEIGERLQRFDNFVRSISGHYNGCFVSVLMALLSFEMHMLIVMGGSMGCSKTQ